MKRRERTDAIKRQRTTGSKACEKGNSSTSGTTRFHSKSGGNNHYLTHGMGGVSHVRMWFAFVPRKRLGLPAKSDNGESTIGCWRGLGKV
jgi:hypothetical protein